MLYRWQECSGMCTKVRGMWAWLGVWYRHVTHGSMAFWKSISRDSWAILDLVRFPKRICITSISQIIAISLRFKLQIQPSKGGVFFPMQFKLHWTLTVFLNKEKTIILVSFKIYSSIKVLRPIHSKDDNYNNNNKDSFKKKCLNLNLKIAVQTTTITAKRNNIVNWNHFQNDFFQLMNNKSNDSQSESILF